MENTFNIRNQRITNLNIHFSDKMTGRTKLEAKCLADLKESKDKNNHSKLLVMKILISSKNDDVNIEFDSETIFDLNKQINDIDEFVKNKLIPNVSDQLFITLDEILLKMGYNKINFARK